MSPLIMRKTALFILLIAMLPLCYGYDRATFSANTETLDYRETNAGVVLDKVQGTAPGVSLSLEKSYQHWFIAPALSFYKNNLAYIGALIGSGIPLVASSENVIIDANLLVGYHFQSFSPYLELGHYRWDREVPPAARVNLGGGYTNVGLNGYSERYQFHYAMIGIRYAIYHSQRLKCLTNIAAGSTLAPMLDSNIPISVPGVGTVSLSDHLGKRPIVHVGVEALYRLNSASAVIFALTYRHFGFGASQVDPLGMFEPRSTTHAVRCTLGLAFDLR